MTKKSPNAAPRGGRPTVHTPELVAEICRRLADGESLRFICTDEGMPSRETIRLWIHENRGDMREQYAAARMEQSDALFDEILEIADDGSNDWMERTDPENPGWKFNGEHYARSRLRVDARKWVASKLNPKKYGDLLKQEVSGPEGEPLGMMVKPTEDQVVEAARESDCWMILSPRLFEQAIRLGQISPREARRAVRVMEFIKDCKKEMEKEPDDWLGYKSFREWHFAHSAQRTQSREPQPAKGELSRRNDEPESPQPGIVPGVVRRKRREAV